MTYARARLWIGICGVGTTVVVVSYALAIGLPHRLLPTTDAWSQADVLGILGFLACFVVLMVPLDLLGGYVLPSLHGRSSAHFTRFFGRWLSGVAVQTSLFVLTAVAILAGGRLAGLAGSLAVITIIAFCYVAMQGPLVRLLTKGSWNGQTITIARVKAQLRELGLDPPEMAFVDHSDAGFTGGVIGLPGLETILIPRHWAATLTAPQLAAAVCRRVEAVKSGSRTRGLMLAFGWTLVGFSLATILPGAGVKSVAELVTTCCGFTLWTFLGLLLLPSVSRFASYAIDDRIQRRGVSQQLLHETLAAIDQLQDDEPHRPALVETIFHPVPSLGNRRMASRSRSYVGAWHAARMTLYLSWACLGLLSRAVHCNAGRPELWVMLPTD